MQGDETVICSGVAQFQITELAWGVGLNSLLQQRTHSNYKVGLLHTLHEQKGVMLVVRCVSKGVKSEERYPQ